MAERRYEIQIEHRPFDQVFSYYHGTGMLHFNASLLARLHKDMPSEFGLVKMDLNEEVYQMCMQHRGIEEPKVDRLTSDEVLEPGYGVLFDDDKSFTMVDGHHRLVKLYRQGVREMGLYLCFEQIWRNCLVTYSPEHEALLAMSVPARVDSPTGLPTRITIEKHKP